MASYGAWNRAIANYFSTGIAKGSPIFLSLDEEAICEISSDFLEDSSSSDPVQDFIDSVASAALNSQRTAIDLSQISRPSRQVPWCVGFLGVLVLAAYRMRVDESFNDSNYFNRLSQVFHLPAMGGRPEGLPPGAEAPLWWAWNHYLTAIGFQPTAEPGIGPQKYIHFALSQAILRDSDGDFLRSLYRQHTLCSRMSTDQLGFWLSRQANLRAHLREGLNHASPARVWEFYQACHKVYEEGGWNSSPRAGATPQAARNRIIECGLYRTVNFLGQASYWAFPKEPARKRVSSLEIASGPQGKPVPLMPERPGFYSPVWETHPFVMEAQEFEVQGDPLIHQMVFPLKDFWVLQQDPEDPAGAWATWKPFLELGDSLLVLTRPGAFDEEMLRFKEAKLVDWVERIQGDDWIEFHGCMVLSYEWGGFMSTQECKALADFLAPRSLAGISLSGGLRDKNQNAWLEEYPPIAKVYGFDRRFELVLSSADSRQLTVELDAQQEYSFPASLPAGTYQVLVSSDGTILASRMFNMITWEKIQPHPRPDFSCNQSPHSTAGVAVRGAMITPPQIG